MCALPALCTVRHSNRLSSAIEQTAEARLLLSFFESGTLAAPPSVPYCNDEEYLSACLNMAQDLGRYCVGRACEVRAGVVQTLTSSILS